MNAPGGTVEVIVEGLHRTPHSCALGTGKWYPGSRVSLGKGPAKPEPDVTASTDAGDLNWGLPGRGGGDMHSY
jgi:hypothetical protein